MQIIAVRYQLMGYYAALMDTHLLIESDCEARATYHDLLLTDNPHFWLIVVLQTRGLTSVQIAMRLCENYAIDYSE